MTNALKAQREALGLTAKEAADLVGLGYLQSWQRYENSTREISEPALRLFNWLTVDLARVLEAARRSRGRLDVAIAVSRIGLVGDADTIIAAIAFGTQVKLPELRASFGKPVAEIVREVRTARADQCETISQAARDIILAGMLVRAPTLDFASKQSMRAFAAAMPLPNPRLLAALEAALSE